MGEGGLYASPFLIKFTETHFLWKNTVEVVTGIQKRWDSWIKKRFKVSKAVWDFLGHYVADIHQFVVKDDDDRLRF